jgi:hypothetical protein
MLDLLQVTNIQEDQQITTILKNLRKEMNMIHPKIINEQAFKLSLK